MKIIRYLLIIQIILINISCNDKNPFHSEEDQLTYQLIIKSIAENINESKDIDKLNYGLIKSIELKKPEISEYFINKGANVNSTNSNGYCALELAIRLNQEEIATFLITRNADYSLLKDSNLSIPEVILKDNYHFSDITIQDIKLCTPINRTKKNVCNVINTKIERINIEHPLVIAVQNNSLEIMKKLIKNNSKIEQSYGEGNPLINLACSKGNIEIIKYLLLQGESINSQDSFDGYTPLLISINTDNFELFKFLLENGADPNIKCFFGDSIDLIIQQKKYKYINILLKNGISKNRLIKKAKKQNQLDILRYLNLKK